MAAELVGGALLSSFLQVAFDRLASSDILDYFQKRKLNETLLKKLNIMMLSINAVVDDAEEKQINNPNVKAWLAEVKDSVYDAEDVLDEINYELTKLKVEAEFQTTTASKVWNFFSASVNSFDKEIESKMKQVLDNLEYLASKKDILGLKEGSGVGLGVGSVKKLPTTSLVDETGIYGRDDDKEIIIKWLLSDNDGSSNLSIISIVGMGGLGKSTLAQLVYNDQRIKNEFDLKVWVCVSEDFDIFRVTRAIIEAITLSNDDTKDINMLQIKLKEKLRGKRFLLILDDVWNENYMQWETLQTPFIHGASGSKILVTSRSDKVASIMRSTKIYSLKELTEEDSWSLFIKYAFRNEDVPPSNSDFEELAKKIIKKCKGLPLALKTMGSLLYTKLSLEEWNNILTSEIWKEENNIIPALRLSYHYLPSLLKRCFAYCSLFPKDYEFNKEHLVQLWMAENLLPCSQHSKGIRDVGNKFFLDLLSRSFFQQSSGDKTRFIMHDLINDLAKYASGEFCFRLEVNEAQSMSELTRHFSYLRNRDEASKRFEVIFKAKRLRTFLPLSMSSFSNRHWVSSKMIHDLLSEFRCLRVLSLSGYLNIIELPSSIGNLKHLRYLDLSGTKVKKLPDSTCLLYNLQKLNLRYCESLEILPSNLNKLINLRHLDIRETKVRDMPKQLGKLKNLQVLSSFYVGKCSETSIKQLRELNLQETLSILELQNVVDPVDASAVNLRNKIFLEQLKLGWSMNNDESHNERVVLEKLQPHQNLTKLSISNYGGTRFPVWFEDNTLFNVVSLELSNCRHCFFLPSLGVLPSLKSLSITGFDSIVAIGTNFYGNSSCTSPFGCLEILRLQEMVGWEEWTCENISGAFPCLQELYIKKCPMLKEHLPGQLPSLTKLVIENCEQLMASVPRAPTIHELVLRNCGNVQLEYLPSTLKILRIRGQFTKSSLVENFENIIANTCLEELDVLDCANMEFPLNHCQNFLHKMRIRSSCDFLRTFPLDLFPKLQSLELMGSGNLEMISVSGGLDHDLTCLTSYASKLEFCWIENLESLKSLPEHMHILFPSLKRIVIRDCPKVESFPKGGLPSNLSSLCISGCPKLLECDLLSHSFLDCLAIECIDLESLPNAGLLPPTLTSLTIFGCSNLEMLDYKGLCHLSTLEVLSLYYCPKLQCLPKEGLPNSLSTLIIIGCPLLTEQCQKQKGKDWGKIAHIPCIKIDNEIIT